MAKTYHTRIPNSTFVAQLRDSNGNPLAGRTKILQFRGSDMTVEDPDLIAQLDECADQPGSTIYTKDPSVVLNDADVPASEVKKRAGDVVAAIAAAGQRA